MLSFRKTEQAPLKKSVSSINFKDGRAIRFADYGDTPPKKWQRRDEIPYIWFDQEDDDAQEQVQWPPMTE